MRTPHPLPVGRRGDPAPDAAPGTSVARCGPEPSSRSVRHFIRDLRGALRLSSSGHFGRRHRHSVRTLGGSSQVLRLRASHGSLGHGARLLRGLAWRCASPVPETPGRAHGRRHSRRSAGAAPHCAFRRGHAARLDQCPDSCRTSLGAPLEIHPDGRTHGSRFGLGRRLEALRRGPSSCDAQASSARRRTARARCRALDLPQGGLHGGRSDSSGFPIPPSARSEA